jgi:hypothetical protein
MNENENEKLVPLNVIDCNGNTIARIPYNGNTVCIDDVISHLMTKFAQINTVLPHIQEAIIELQQDMVDHTEAFEHTDDSLHNLRHTVSAIKGEENE